MKQYLDLLRNIIHNGTTVPDDDRLSVYGGFDSFDLTGSKLPLVTTELVNTKNLIHELLFFISGSITVKGLQESGVDIWNDWAIKKENVREFFDTYFGHLPEAEFPNFVSWYEKYITSIGPLYGAMWRNAPCANPNPVYFDITLEEIPSDKLKLYRDKYTRLKLEENNTSFGAFIVHEYYRTIDQFNELVRSLKKNPYSHRHIVESWIPETVATEKLKPEHNAMIARGVLPPHCKTFQCFVKPPLEEGGKKRLVLWLHQASVDAVKEAPHVIAQYSLLAHMLAKECDMEAVEFQWSRGVTYIHQDQLKKVNDQLECDPYSPPTVWLSPEVKSIFDYKFEDIQINGYFYNYRLDTQVGK